MAQTIKLKRSSTGGAVPSTSSLSLGEVAINTHDGKMYIKKNDGSDAIVEIGAGNGEAVWNSYDYTATSSQTSFSGSDNNSETLSYVPNFLQVFLNGILLDPAVDYAATTGNSIVLTVGATTSDLIQIETFTQIIGTGDILVDTFPVSSTQTAFTLSQDPINKSNISVYVEGVYQESSTYSLSTTTLTLSESPANGTTVEVVIGTRNVTLDGIVDLTISGTLHAGALDLGDANIINVNEISLDTIKGDADANTNITFAGSDVTTFTQGGTERLRLNTTGAQVTGNIVVSGNVDGRDVAADGVTADAALPRTGGAMGGAITTNSTFDGRDVSVDGTKLDGIESSATADQTDVEIRAAVESASDSNVFTNADHSKLDAIEASADVTDATNVTAAGALMRAGGTMTGALDMGSNNITTTGKMLFANVYSATGDLPSASTYHGMFAHVHGTGKGYFAHAGSWVELANQSGLTSTTTIANAALPKAGGTMTGNLQLNNAVELRTLDTGGNARTIVRANSSNELEFGWSANAPVKFMGGGSYTERMRIHTNGNVGIGTDNPPNLLSVRKTITAYEDVISIIGQNSPTDIMGALAYDQATDLMIIRNDQTHATGGIAFRAGGTANHLFIKTGGNVGIGTASPTQKLEVDGDIRIKDARSLFFKRHGDNYAWRIRNESAASGGTYGFNGSNDLVFEVVSNSNANATPAVGSHSVYPSSANTLVLTETGKVGIGTATPAGKLHINAGTNRNLRISNGIQSTTGIDIQSVNDAVNANMPLTLSGSLIALMEGNVGIGQTSPSTLLHVGKSTTAASVVTITHENADGYGSLDIDSYGSATFRMLSNFSGSTMNGMANDTFSLMTPHNYPILFGTGGAERMRISGTGDISFATAGTSTMLKIESSTNSVEFGGAMNGDLPDYTTGFRRNATTSGSTYFPINVGGGTHLAARGYGIGFDPEGYGYRNKIAIIAEGDGTGYSRGKLHIAMRDDADGDVVGYADAALTVLPTKKVGIGTTDPAYPLHVYGANYSVKIESSTGYANLGSNNTSYFHFAGNRTFYFDNRCEASGGFHTYSDERLKENIVAIPTALNKVALMNGVTFNWKDAAKRGGNDTGKQFGVTAQNMATIDSELPSLGVDPLAVAGNEETDEKYYTMDYTRITPFLIEAVKELKTKLEAAEARIATLEG